MPYHTSDSTIQVRIAGKTKKEVLKILEKIGIDMSSAIKLYLNQIVITKAIPFRLVTENGLTLQQEKNILKAEQEAEEGINIAGPFSTAKEVKNYLNSLK